MRVATNEFDYLQERKYGDKSIIWGEMKKIKWVCVCMFAISLIFCGCTKQTTTKKSEKKAEKSDSRIDEVSDNHDLACLDNTIVFFTNKDVCFYDIETGNVVTDNLNTGYNVLEVSAGEQYFYVFLENIEEHYLRLYNQDGSLFQEMSVPFQRILVSDGTVYVYQDSDYEFSAFDCRIGNIEATHYLSEEEFLADIAADISDWNEAVSDWNEMSGEESLQIGTKIFYPYPADGFSHKIPFYCDDKQLTRIQQFYFTQYIDGELATPPDRAMTRNNLEQLQGMMKKKEKNFKTYASEVDGIMYGVCNVYKSQSLFLVSTMDTGDVDYSFSFFYNEDTDSLEKIEEYEGVELIYSDGKHVITHKVDGVYYIDQTTGQEDKVLDYADAIGVTVFDGLLQVRKNEHNADEGEEESDQKEDTVFVKRLWEE
ncbi:MAG: hypothetical protein J1E62_01950 [Lachnospiraceae bacterium]|nr:hypothetical protein [Lachnospiraceae bacterium]